MNKEKYYITYWALKGKKKYLEKKEKDKVESEKIFWDYFEKYIKPNIKKWKD